MTFHTESLWNATHQLRRFAPLAGDRDTDVAVVGGGISGLTAAVLLARHGARVSIIERDRIGSGETGHTTSHLTDAVDGRYQTLIRDFGEDHARLVGSSSRAAIDRIEAFTRETGFDCGFARVPGFLYTERQQDVDWLASELDAARRAGCTVQWEDQVPLPFKTAGAIRWESQAQLHAICYLEALLHEAAAHGVRIYETTRVVGVHDGDPCLVETDHGTIRARDVFVAANVPVNNRVLLHTKIAAYRSYAIATEVRASEAEAMRGLFWDTDDPYHYTRVHETAGRMYLIVGGEDHRTGEDAETDACYERLLQYARERFGIEQAKYRWSGQIIEPVDGLPFIGLNTAAKHVYVATGYSGNGITFGTLAGMIVSDLVAGRDNPYAALYDATRVKPIASAYDYVAENVAFPAQLLKDRLTSSGTEDRPIEALAAGEGGVFATSEGKLAVCRDRNGTIHSCSAVCTHLGCDVGWNHAEQTWDCPCHGSRFSPEGKVLNGPAVTDLAWKPIPAPASRR
jgi:glycine/D-amino acid oxidase-like deaminating enzyme/nitrite reductase/ring-hydroxylating ferredoxin subunit